MLGYIAENRLTNLSDSAQWSDVQSYQDRGYLLLDVRSDDEFAQGAVPGALNIPLDELRDRLAEIPVRDLLVSCQVGQRGHVASRLLSEVGFHALNLDGGYETWSHSPAAALGQLVR
jgi:rhodanese-related sulfurtransferase